MAAPLVIYVSMRQQADRLLGDLKDWLIANNSTVMMVLFLIFGAKLIGDGLAILGA